MRTLPILLTLPLLLGACAAVRQPAPVETAYTIEVETARYDHRVAPGFDAGARAALARFLADVGVAHGDRVRLAGGSAADRAAVAGHLADRLLPVAFAGEEHASAAGGVRLSVLRPVAQPPACGDWSGDPTGPAHNGDFPPLGCASQANLAAMLADPSDVLGGAGLAPANGENPASWVRAYREDRIRIVPVDAATATTGD